VILLVWKSWAKVWSLLHKILILQKRSVKATVSVMLRLLGTLEKWVQKEAPRAAVLISLLVAGTGLLLAGQHGISFSGSMLLLASTLVAWGLYCHLFLRRGYYCLENDSAMLRKQFIIFTLALGCSVWSLGYYQFSVEALWGLLPLMGAIYACFPALHQLGRQMLSNYRSYILLSGWLIFTIALYSAGLLAIKVGNENYFFTFGALALVFAVRACILGIEPILRKISFVPAERIYFRTGSIYIFEAAIILIATAMMLSVGYKRIAEQMAIAVYYCLLIGAFQEVWVLCKGKLSWKTKK
jgi:hypothetical protein